MFERIVSNPNICHGKPCIKGTRIPVTLIVNMVADGMARDEIVRDYPSLTSEDIEEVLRYAAKLCEQEAYTS